MAQDNSRPTKTIAEYYEEVTRFLVSKMVSNKMPTTGDIPLIIGKHSPDLPDVLTTIIRVAEGNELQVTFPSDSDYPIVEILRATDLTQERD